MTDVNYAGDPAIPANTPPHVKSLLHNLEQAAGNIGFPMNANKTEFMRFKREGAISTLCCKPLKLINKFTYIGSNNSSTENNISIYLDVNRLSIVWKSDLSDRIKRDFSRAVTVSILLYGCTTWMLINFIQKRYMGTTCCLIQIFSWLIYITVVNWLFYRITTGRLMPKWFIISFQATLSI